jgi:hypothetical protein
VEEILHKPVKTWFIVAHPPPFLERDNSENWRVGLGLQVRRFRGSNLHLAPYRRAPGV